MYKTYEEFWLYYVSEHRKRSTRVWHAVGTTLVLVALVYALATQQWWWLLAVPVLGYGPAWVSHFFIERNRPATFTYPLWSLRGDFHMYGLMLTGRMGREVARCQRRMEESKR
ncbi:MAG TPA: DUF962 domain-containing protein [Bacilli bacterium]|nr:DUF962 domain-containing protein [Bacilli bacterium]